jgi:hypothetical protein
MVDSEKKATNVMFYIFTIFFLVVFVGGIKVFYESALTNPNSNLDDDSIVYITNVLTDIDISRYNSTSADLEENPARETGNNTGESLKDFAIEFFYSQSKGDQYGLAIKDIVLFPNFILRLLNIPYGILGWILTPLYWYWYYTVILSIYYLIRGIK